MKRLLNEIVNITYENLGNNLIYAYIDPKTSESTFPIKEKIKQYGAAYDRDRKIWGWTLQGKKDPKINNIRAFINDLNTFETPPVETGKPREVEEILSTLGQLEQALRGANPSNMFTTMALRDKVQDFKRTLMYSFDNAEKSKEIIAKMLKIRYENTQYESTPLKIQNTILIMLQKPDATQVRPTKEWENLGYIPTANAVPIGLLRPNMKNGRKLSDAEKKEVEKEYLEHCGKNSVEELNLVQQEMLRKKLNRAKQSEFLNSYSLYYAYDRSDVTRDPNAKKYMDIPKYSYKPYYSDSSEENEYSVKLIEGLIKWGTNLGLKYNFVEQGSLEQANGNTYTTHENGEEVGIINVVGNVKNFGCFKTAVHETAHQLMHFEFLSKKSDYYKKFYYGREDNNKIEQQADLCAWVVMASFGIDWQASMIYTKSWGMTEDTAMHVFDTIFDVADFIHNGVLKFGDPSLRQFMAEYSDEKPAQIQDGEDVAAITGDEKLYMKSKKLNGYEVNNGIPQPSGVETKQINEQRQKFWDFFNRINKNFF